MSRLSDDERARRKAERKAARRAAKGGSPAGADAAGAMPTDASPSTVPDAAAIAARRDPGVDAAARAVEAARTGMSDALDGAVDAGRLAADPREWFRRDPIRTAAFAGGAGFLAVGGPKRVLRAASRLVTRRPSGAGLLPDEIERVLKDAGLTRDPKVRSALERDFAAYLQARGKAKPAASASASFWRTYDVLIGPIGNRAARTLVERLFEAAGTEERRSP